MDENPIARRSGITIAIAVLLGVLLALAALLDIGPCADDALTAEEFVAQGDEVCSEAHDEFLDLQESPPRTPGDAAELARALVEVAAEERNAIADLNEPAELADLVDRYLEARDRGIGLLRDGQAAAEDSDPAAYERVQAELASSQVDPRYELARQIGFAECSKPLVDRDELARQAEPPASTDPDAPPTVNNPPTGPQ